MACRVTWHVCLSSPFGLGGRERVLGGDRDWAEAIRPTICRCGRLFDHYPVPVFLRHHGCCFRCNLWFHRNELCKVLESVQSRSSCCLWFPPGRLRYLLDCLVGSYHLLDMRAHTVVWKRMLSGRFPVPLSEQSEFSPEVQAEWDENIYTGEWSMEQLQSSRHGKRPLAFMWLVEGILVSGKECATLLKVERYPFFVRRAILTIIISFLHPLFKGSTRMPGRTW